MSSECMFWEKVGACRHGSKCVRKHSRPEQSTVLVCVGMLQPKFTSIEDTAAFVEDVFSEIVRIAPLKDMLVAANTAPHLQGNVYLAFTNVVDAQKVHDNLNCRWHAGRPIFCEAVGVRDLRSACCREASCNRQLECNYVHPVGLSREFWNELYASRGLSMDRTQRKSPQKRRAYHRAGGPDPSAERRRPTLR